MVEKRLLLAVIGTRPELIKMAPVIRAFENDPHFNMQVCFSGQHRELIDSVFKNFELPIHYKLDLMAPNQTLSGFAGKFLLGFSDIIEKSRPAAIFAQGDTSTTFITSLAAFYSKTPFFHVEAGLRTFDFDNPYPEEANRVLTGTLTNLHFAPTELARNHLLQEGVDDKKIIVTGNTVVDALLEIKKDLPPPRAKGALKQILVTVHRRENFGAPLVQILEGVKALVMAHPEVNVLLPVHPNPNVRSVVYSMLGNVPRVSLVEPLGYLALLDALQNSYLILTDSGGIQEEAPSFGKPVFVLREVTERMESVEAGVAKLVGADQKRIVEEVSELLRNEDRYQRMVAFRSPFGDGKAAQRIVSAVHAFFQP
jgi:UDP-N-acetylglucosamine 2-epimerase (non-hydrolysing)